MKKTLLAASFLALGAFTFVAPAIAFADDGSATVKSVDKDSDGTIDMQEAKTAAMAKFATSRQGQGTARSTPRKPAWTSARPIPTRTARSTRRSSRAALGDTFKAADTDHDGTVDAKELASPEGQKLQAMIN